MPLLFQNDPHRFRTREQMIDDVYNVFMVNTISSGAKLSVLQDVLWQYTFYFGRNRYLDCPYWSEKAIILLKDCYDRFGSRDKFNFGDYFIHEHVVPRNLIVDRILSLYHTGSFTKDKVKVIFQKCLIGVVITKDENTILNRNSLRENMPGYLNNKNLEDYSGQDVWSRYNILYKFLNFKINVFGVKRHQNNKKDKLEIISIVN